VLAELGDLTREPWLAKLIASADAIVEDHGPGRLEAAGLSPETIRRTNQRLAVLRISPFGQTGPLASERATTGSPRRSAGCSSRRDSPIARRSR